LKRLHIAQKIGDVQAEGNAWNNLGLAQAKTKEYSQAEQSYRQALDCWKRLREKLSQDQKISIFEQQQTTYLALQEVLISQNRMEEALEVSEQSRTQALLDQLTLFHLPTTSSPSSSPSSGDTPRHSVASMKQFANQHNATLLEFSLWQFESQDKANLVVWIVRPHSNNIEFHKLNIVEEDLINNLEIVRNTFNARSQNRDTHQTTTDTPEVMRPLKQKGQTLPSENVKERTEKASLESLSNLYDQLIRPI
jgi:tetratricopeptide (TPR) repeat protein